MAAWKDTQDEVVSARNSGIVHRYLWPLGDALFNRDERRKREAH